ncbi:MAG: hypothetical protein GWN30_38430, partial [Gammaproteobacteria bacterium]|nr:hypothetical protein [Gammaproteobacteria bacterium]
MDIILPAGLSLVSGPTTDLFDLPPAGVQSVSWDVQGASLGVHNMDITGFSSSYGESFSRTITDNLEVVSGTVGPIVFFDYTIDDDN